VIPKKLDEKPDLSTLKGKEENYRDSYKKQYDKKHGTRNLPELRIGQKVWIKDLKRDGVVTSLAKEPRSYWVKTEKCMVRRNCYHLIPYEGHSSQPSGLTLKPLSKFSSSLPIVQKEAQNSSLPKLTQR
jgi:hypothetical protein